MRENLESHGIFFILQASVKAEVMENEVQVYKTLSSFLFFVCSFFCLFVCFLVDAKLRRENQWVTQ